MTQNKTDYAAVQSWFEWAAYSAHIRVPDHHKEAIRKALKLADRLERGEVSEEMVKVFKDYQGPAVQDFLIVETYKAMTAQLLKEIGDD